MKTLALDIGGANLKAAHQAGAVCEPFALWKQPGELADRLRSLVSRFTFDRLAVTMTAELCDCFATKREGVGHVLEAVEAVSGGKPVKVWTTGGRFVSTDEARRDPLACAAANWHALATFVASLGPDDDALLVDIGSTTTDLIPLRRGKVAALGRTDPDRLRYGELLYLGATRTPLMAVDIGRPAMAEYFATTKDTGVLTGRLPPDATDTDTADGRPVTVPCCAARVLRMIGADLEMMSVEDARRLAREYERALVERVRAAIAAMNVERVIVSGSGAAIAVKAAEGAGIERLADRIGEPASVAACAFALLRLGEQPR